MRFTELLRKRIDKGHKKAYQEYCLTQRLKGEKAISFELFQARKVGGFRKPNTTEVYFDEYHNIYPEDFSYRGGVKKKGKTKYLRK